eukprot:SAG11_NODE_2251_length_3633_cov_15.438031_4_plen_103_part_00
MAAANCAWLPRIHRQVPGVGSVYVEFMAQTMDELRLQWRKAQLARSPCALPPLRFAGAVAVSWAGHAANNAASVWDKSDEEHRGPLTLAQHETHQVLANTCF